MDAASSTSSVYILVAIIAGAFALLSALITAVFALVAARRSDAGSDRRSFIEELRNDRNDAREELRISQVRIRKLEKQLRKNGIEPE